MRAVPAVVVITLTRNRPEKLRKAMRSIAAQLHPAVQHLVVGDRCDFIGDSVNRVALEREFPRSVVIANEHRTDSYLPTHLARLRARAAADADAEFVSMLDDDNLFEDDHLTSLADAVAVHDVGAAHSWRSLWDDDDQPWLIGTEDPWVPDPRLSRISFERLAHEGVFETGTNVVRDRARYDVGMGRVDTNEWFLTRELFLEYSRPTPPSPAERRLGLTEDALMTLRMVRAGVPIVTSGRATVRYFMGGYSNQNVDGVAIDEQSAKGR
ncbi:MAG: glycosyltransferase family 2 protein [Microbacterium sp.]